MLFVLLDVEISQCLLILCGVYNDIMHGAQFTSIMSMKHASDHMNPSSWEILFGYQNNMC